MIFWIFFSALCLLEPRLGGAIIFAQSGENYVITTIAGSGVMSAGGDGGPAIDGQLFFPNDVAIDGQGTIYIADSGNHKIRIVTPDGKIDTFAGNGTAGYGGDGGPARMAQLNIPHGVAIDVSGNLYIAEFENARIRKVSPQGIITTVAGTGAHGFGGDGGPATAAQLNHPRGVAVDLSRNVYIADSSNHRIRKLSPDGVITTVAGTGVKGYGGDGGPATSAQITYPWDVALDSAGNIYFSDSENDRIRMVNAQGIVNIFSEKAAALGLAVDASGTVYSGSGGFIKKISPACCTKVEMSASYQNRNVPFIVAAHFQRSEDRVKLSASPRTSVWLKA